ncbi:MULTISPECIES: hypothetical protein [Halolamina]|uniref:Uncharacterized protein n=1 Tax=Halolamina pelagica TaxID=699431 RepID=A0A1I5QAQ9_9EURY|nr:MULTISPECIES: hypothetical protein [Halolamina]NHX35177.1 hypothetical protein [Halolamina sp. R1-12]SFP43323.1 hypothetical protein SAMN05216277_103338 [Halolamina pelagica]
MTEPEPGELGADPLPPADHPLVGDRHEAVDLPVIEPGISRDSVESDGRVGAVAYPFRVYEAEIEVDRPLLAPRTDRRVISVDRSRRLAVRADTLPEVEERHVKDVLVLPGELSPDQADEKAREAAFQWTLRGSILADAPEIEFANVVEAYKLFWLADRPGGDVIVDSVRGEERPFEG